MMWASGHERARDHPRSRGVYNLNSEMQTAGFGSSPLARGLLEMLLLTDALAGIIPARAGFTMAGVQHVDLERDHPRSRGVYTILMAAP